MNSILVRRLAALIPVALFVGATSATAAPILVDFESDATLVNLANGFSSAATPGVRFSDTSGADLIIINSATVSNGTNALAVFNDHDDSALLIELDFVANQISLDFGNDDPLFSLASDQAVLTTFLGGTQVGEVMVALNRNSAMDQNIAFDGANFDSATLKFAVNPLVGLTEVVDNVSITSAIPEPSAALVFAVGALVLGGVHGRRASTRVKPRGVRR
jgi:hypothetical protein